MAEPHGILMSSLNNVQPLASMEQKQDTVFKQLKSRHWRVSNVKKV